MVCVSAATPGSANRTSVAAEIVGAILKFPPLWEAASKGAKEKMVKRAGELGIEWDSEVSELRSATDWEQAHAFRDVFFIRLARSHESRRRPLRGPAVEHHSGRFSSAQSGVALQSPGRANQRAIVRALSVAPRSV